jgi:hypothetical protein
VESHRLAGVNRTPAGNFLFDVVSVCIVFNTGVVSMRVRCLTFFTALGLLASVVAAHAQTSLKAAGGKVDITPDNPVYIAGYGSNRKSTGVHDRLMARCLVLEQGKTRLAIVSCDLIGVPRFHVEKIKAMVKTVPPDNVYVAATHVHSGPDTMGQWGPDIRTSGVDQAWMTAMRAKVARLIDTTAAGLQPAKLKFANTTQVPRISKNSRVPQILDTELGVIQAVHPQSGKPIATLVNYACHPEVLNNRQMTADFPHWLYQTVEDKTEAVCVYMNGALGGMVTADYDEKPTDKGMNWKAAEDIGRGMGGRVLELIAGAETQDNTPIALQRTVFQVPMENQNFLALIKLGVFPKEVLVGNDIVTEVSRITIGTAEILTLPGEVLPNIGLYLKRHMTGNHKFLFGLTNDELGYILTKEDFGLPIYAYESSVSIGEQMGERMVAHLLALLKKGQSQ